MASVHKDERVRNGVKKAAWVVRYKSGGKHRSKAFPFKKQADEFKLKVLRETEEGIHIPVSEKQTVEQVCDAFLRYTEDRRRDGRIGGHHLADTRFAVLKSIVPLIGIKRFADLTTVDLEQLYTGMLRRGGLAPTTAKKRMGVLRAIEDFAIKRRFAARSPVRTYITELRNIPKHRIRTFSPDQVNQLLRSLATRRSGGRVMAHAFRNVVVNIAAFCGLRYGEIMGLTVGNVDLDGRVLRVRHNLSQHDGLKAPKTRAGIRDVPVPAHVVLMLREWIERYHTPNDRGLVFQTELYSPPNSSRFHSSHWRPMLQRTGLGGDDPLHFHALRHFAASWWIANGMALPDVAALLGHSKFDMTLQVYAHSVVGGSQRHDMVEGMATRLLEAPLTLDFVTGSSHPLND